MCNYQAIILATTVAALAACQPHVKPPTPPIDPPTVEHINLTSDTLFEFNRADSSDLTPSGRTQLNQVAETLTKRYMQLESIELIGHTDRLGRADYNYNLGMQRAKTVYDYLVERGVPAQVISYKSAGENDPVTQGCPEVTPRAQLIQCLQPDRRVSIHVRGIKKAL